MRYLLDTHIWLWMLREPHKLSSLVHQALPTRQCTLLSPISIWEVTVLLERKGSQCTRILPCGSHAPQRTWN